MIILLIIFSFLAIYYLTCALFISDGIRKVKSEKREASPNEFISVIIPFRNESENILRSIKSIIKQDYPLDNYEVIYVDDKSEDDSLEKIIKAEKPCNMKVISVPSDYLSDSSKIRAIKFGIDNSKGEIILITDCDCIHNSKWLDSMLKCFNYQTGFVAGPVAFIDEGTVFNELQKLEFTGLILATAGLIGINKPIICNSANLAFRKKAYDLAGGFQINANSFSSADEFLMLSIKNKTVYKVKFSWDKNSVARTIASSSIKDFFSQRKRWASKDWKQFGIGILSGLILVYLFFAGLIVQLILGIFSSVIFLYAFIVSLVIKFISEYLILKYGRELYYNQKIFRIFLLAEFFHIPYILFAVISGLFGGFTWKNRKNNK